MSSSFAIIRNIERVLANEFLATRLAERVGVPVPAAEVVEVQPWLVEHTAELTILLGNNVIRRGSGTAVRIAIRGESGGRAGVRLSASGDARSRAQPGDVCGNFALDKWTCNADGRQAAFWRKMRERKYSASFIDQGVLLQCGRVDVPRFPLRGVYPRNEVYARVNGWESFEPWLSRIEKLDEDSIWRVAGNSASMVWRFLGRTGNTGAAADRTKGDCAGADPGVPKQPAAPVSGVDGELVRMTQLRQLELHLLRFLPHPLRDDFVTVGLLLVESDGGFADVRFTHDFRMLQCVAPDLDPEWFASGREGDSQESGGFAAARRPSPADQRALRHCAEMCLRRKRS